MAVSQTIAGSWRMTPQTPHPISYSESYLNTYRLIKEEITLPTLTILVFHDANRKNSERFVDVLQKILRSELQKSKYEIIFLGHRDQGFAHVTLYKSDPLVRAFYDGVLNRTQRLNAAVAEAHCETILIWPGMFFNKSDFKPIPEDVVSTDYYLKLYFKLYGIQEMYLKSSGVELFGKHHYQVNFKDTIRLLHKVFDVPWKIKLWYLGWLIKSIGR